MGIRIRIGDNAYEASAYSVQEDSTPTKSDDSTGSVGALTFSIPKTPGLHPWMWEGLNVTLADTRRGSTIGFVSGVTENDHGDIQVTCQSRLGKLNIYGAQAQPFQGTLRDAFAYYLSLANQDYDLLVDPQIVDRPVIFQGWTGELWFYLKQMAAAQDCEIALVSNILLLRPLGTREAVQHKGIARSRTYGGSQLARSVEVYYYNNRPITEQLVYHPGGWSDEVEVISVGAGQEIERTLELSASVTSVVQPVMQTFVGPDVSDASVYTVVGDDGLPIPPQQWADQGGWLRVTVDPSTNTLTLKVRGANRIANKDRTIIANYSIALGSDTSGNRYSTLRILGTGVAYNKELVTVRTCVDDSLTGTEVGITIDNPFLSTQDQAYSAGVKSARLYAGHKMVINGQLTTINQLGDNGSAVYPRYSFDQAQHQGKTYAQVRTLNLGKTYYDIEQAYYAVVRSDFDNQVFGNANGVRVWDNISSRYYRVRTATTDPATVDFEAEDDLTNDDVQAFTEPLTYALDKLRYDGLTYTHRDRMGLSNV